jgi:hypothetical protein
MICNLDVGCERAGVCYAEADGKPEHCGAIDRCEFCGCLVDMACEFPPIGICETAINAFYGDPTK